MNSGILLVSVSAASLAAMTSRAGATLTNYWPLDETSGTTVANTVPGGTAGILEGGEWVADDQRGNVLRFDGASYVDAGFLPDFPLDGDFTWAFWANSEQGPNNNVIIGNRYPDEGWIKFTTNSFEFRDISPSYNATIDYPDFATDEWVHHAVVKRGPLFTYFRNGVPIRASAVTVDAPSVPFYFGGNEFQENWAGLLDDVATWSSALPPDSIAGLAAGTYTPATAPLTPTPPAVAPILTEDFSGDLSQWNIVTRGLESTGESTYDPPAIVNGELVLGGVTNGQYWLGTSVESVQTFDSRIYTEVEVKRVALDGSGTAWRSSLWIFGDDAHFLHFAQNVGENGWQYNANDVGGLGSLNPVGSGNNIPGLDDLDGDTDSHVMSIRIIPLSQAGHVSMEMLVDGVPYAAHGFTNFPATFKVILTGQARAVDDFVTATFDDVVVRRETVNNIPPAFSTTTVALPSLAEGGELSFDAAALASDPENDPLTFAKASGPDWISVSSAGVVTGTAPAGSAGFVSVDVTVQDAGGVPANLNLRLRVEPPGLSDPPLFGWWPLNEGSGSVANDVSGGNRHGTIQNAETGGLNEDGSAWTEDPVHGTVLSFNGDDDAGANPGAYVIVGNPPDSGTLPIFTLSNGFAWSFWAKPEQNSTTEFLLGNRYDPFGSEYDPREFVKFTGLSFEWHTNGAPQDVDYPDLSSGVWHHHVAVKEGANLYYYRDGVFVNGRTITDAPYNDLPLYIAGQGVENWRGYMKDVRVFTGSLSGAAVKALFDAGPGGPTDPPVSGDFAIQSVSLTNAETLTVSVPSTAGQQFTAQVSTDLTSWQTVGSVVTATGAETTLTVPLTGGARYVRVLRQ